MVVPGDSTVPSNAEILLTTVSSMFWDKVLERDCAWSVMR